MWHNWWGGWWIIMPLVMLAFLGAFIWFMVAIGRAAPALPRIGPDPEEDAERILAERYARGEIDDDEYRRRLDTLRGAAPTASR